MFGSRLGSAGKGTQIVLAPRGATDNHDRERRMYQFIGIGAAIVTALSEIILAPKSGMTSDSARSLRAWRARGDGCALKSNERAIETAGERRRVLASSYKSWANEMFEGTYRLSLNYFQEKIAEKLLINSSGSARTNTHTQFHFVLKYDKRSSWSIHWNSPPCDERILAIFNKLTRTWNESAFKISLENFKAVQSGKTKGRNPSSHLSRTSFPFPRRRTPLPPHHYQSFRFREILSKSSISFQIVRSSSSSLLASERHRRLCFASSSFFISSSRLYLQLSIRRFLCERARASRCCSETFLSRSV